MVIYRRFIQNGKIEIPSMVIAPDNSRGAAIFIHGYGGSKEEQLGFAWRIAETGLTAIAIDLRGHGENPLSMDEGIVSDLGAVIAYGKGYGKVATIGHSLGGRLALLSDADFAIAVSPALNQEFSESTQSILRNKRSYRVRESFPDANFEILRKLPLWKPDSKEAMILYGTRDVPEIIQSCQNLKIIGVRTNEIDQALHSDTFLIEPTFRKVIDQFREWY